MAFNIDSYSEESDTNIKFGWAAQVLQIINQINTYNYLCTVHDFTALRPLYSHLLVLRDMMSAKFPKEIMKVDAKLKTAEEFLMNFETRRFNMINPYHMKRNGRDVHNLMRKAYEELMIQMKYHGILDTLRMDVKTMARNAWYGDARPVN